MTIERTFHYNEHILPDPGAQYTNEQVRQHLAAEYFPELGQCAIQVGAEKDGKVDITFVKRVTTKSARATRATIGSDLLIALQQMDCISAETPPPTLQAYFSDMPTVATLLQAEHAPWLDGYLEEIERASSLPYPRNTAACFNTLPSRPPQHLPSGF